MYSPILPNFSPILMSSPDNSSDDLHPALDSSGVLIFYCGWNIKPVQHGCFASGPDSIHIGLRRTCEKLSFVFPC